MKNIKTFNEFLGEGFFDFLKSDVVDFSKPYKKEPKKKKWRDGIDDDLEGNEEDREGDEEDRRSAIEDYEADHENDGIDRWEDENE